MNFYKIISLVIFFIFFLFICSLFIQDDIKIPQMEITKEVNIEDAVNICIEEEKLE